MLILSIFLIIISLIISCFALYKIKNINKIDNDILNKNNQIKQENKKLSDKLRSLQQETSETQNNLMLLNHDVLNANNRLQEIHRETETVLNNKEKLSNRAFENYCAILEENYKKAEDEYAQHEELLKESYSKVQSNLISRKEQIEKELAQIEATRTAALQAQLKEKEIKEKLSFYCVQVNQNDLDDIKILERMKNQLHNPRILSMLIWSTYFQKPMTTLCNNVIGTTVKSGIYKITNQKDNMCYIGQAVDLARRWKDHAKCGLGIDTPTSNKLYKAMIEDGLWNFSFEILEECPSAQLNEKEKYYIQLYKSYEFGYNSNKGITK
jgi:hypothetical protein